MDHKVSKDMISSGMTPSGEKTQADLGRTQYGSAPSPSKLMDAYESMYQNQKQENLDEKIDPLNLGASKRTLQQKQQDRKIQSVKSGMADTGSYMDKKEVPQNKKENSTDVDDKKKDKSKGFGESNVDLLAAYRAVYEHHQKDENGNTIPHEDDVKEGAGLYANIHAKRKRGGKMRKKGAKGAPSSQDFANAAKTAKEDVDLFDVISGKLIEEGYSEKESYEIMANLTDEQLEKINEAVVTGTLATLGVLGKLLAGGAAKAAVAGKGLAAAAKGGAMAAKGLAKGAVKGAVSAGKNVVSTGKNVVSGTQNIANKALTKVQSIAKSPNKGPKITQSGGDVVQGSDKSKESALEKLEKNYYRYQMAKSLVPQGSGGSTSVNKTGTVSASADLFDIVKGQLLDEGLSEEEIRDIMLELTPEEILVETGLSADLLKRAAKGAEAARGMAAASGNRELAKKKLAQGAKFSDAMRQKNLEKSRSENMRKPTGPMASRPQPDPTRPYPGTPR